MQQNKVVSQQVVTHDQSWHELSINVCCSLGHHYSYELEKLEVTHSWNKVVHYIFTLVKRFKIDTEIIFRGSIHSVYKSLVYTATLFWSQ